MSNWYDDMTSAERLAERIAKNRSMEQRLLSGMDGLSLESTITRLNERKRRATYGAVAELVGVLPPGLMSGRPGSYRDSWVVSGTTGRPTGYAKNQIHPDCYRQICDLVDNVIDTGEALRRWIINTM